jgi:hypothetical protein
MYLQPAQFAPLHAAMEQHFSPLDMQRLLQERCNVRMDNITGHTKAFQHQVVDISTHFQQRNLAEVLVTALRDARPSVAAFVRLADSIGFTRFPAGGFEVLLDTKGPAFADVEEFRTRLAKLEDAVCRVETPAGYGTGLLIAPDRVLTNFHVVERVVADGALTQIPTCLFGHRKAGAGANTPARRFDATRLLAWSPPSVEDTQAGHWNIDVDKLDYAVLELREPAGALPLVQGGEARGYVALSAAPATVEGDPLLILQHPNGQPMKIDLGSVTAARPTRLRYNVNTDKGSSGAPAFNRRLELVALHHVGIDWPADGVPYNQGIPMAAIRDHAAQRGVDL